MNYELQINYLCFTFLNRQTFEFLLSTVGQAEFVQSQRTFQRLEMNAVIFNLACSPRIAVTSEICSRSKRWTRTKIQC
jgi:uncharacterized membrane protein